MTENEAMLLGKLSAATARTAEVEAKLADCKRRERAAVERAEALRAFVEDSDCDCDPYGDDDVLYCRRHAALAADEEARA